MSDGPKDVVAPRAAADDDSCDRASDWATTDNDLAIFKILYQVSENFAEWDSIEATISRGDGKVISYKIESH